VITEEDKKEIFQWIKEAEDRAIERALLLIPETVGNMMAHAATMNKLNRDFLTKYPEFKNNMDSVKAVVEKVEGKNTLMKYGDILEKAVPEIRERIKTVEKLDTSLVAQRPKLNFNGEL